MEDKNCHKSIALTVCLIAVGILVAAALMCIGIFAILMHAGIISVKHFPISLDWEWNFWTCLEAIGTIGATIVALFGLNLKEAREKRWAVAKMVSSWISEDSKPNADGTAYVRTATIHVNNESDEPVYDVTVNTTLDNGKHWLGPLSAPDLIPVLPAHRELQFDITIPMLGYRHMDTPQVACTFVDPNGRVWERNIDGKLRDCSKEKPHWVDQQDDELPVKGEDFTPFNSMAVCLMFLNTLNKDPHGEAMRALISPQATGWEKVDWDELKRDYGNCVPTSNVRFPAPHVAVILLVADGSLQGKKAEGRGMTINAAAAVTLTFSQEQGWRVFGIGDRVLPEDILFPEGTLTQELG
nr:hypothetical protein [Bifidobacterium catenulatum]